MEAGDPAGSYGIGGNTGVPSIGGGARGAGGPVGGGGGGGPRSGDAYLPSGS